MTRIEKIKAVSQLILRYFPQIGTREAVEIAAEIVETLEDPQ